MSGFTKEIIAKTFTELLDEKPMSKITVKDIVERCGVNRNTFYYHFKDIPDVVEFILKKKWDEILEHPQDRASILECMEEMADLVRNNRKVMFNVYRSVKKDTFLFYMNEISNYIIMEYFRKNADQFDLDEEIESKIDAMADDAMKSGNIAVNPRSSRKQDIVELYHKAL